MRLFVHNSRAKGGNKTKNTETGEVSSTTVPFAVIMGSAISQCFQSLEEFMFPKSPLVQHLEKSESSVRGGVLLRGCRTPMEHYESIQRLLRETEELRGSEGLQVLGLEYRIVHCDEHKVHANSDMKENGHDTDRIASSDVEGICYEILVTGGDGANDNKCHDIDDEITVEGEVAFEAMAARSSRSPRRVSQKPNLICSEITESIRSNDGSYFSTNVNDSHFAEIGTTTSLSGRDIDCLDRDDASAAESLPFCHLCTRRLFHVASNTMVTLDNRNEFIADGDMYEVATRLVQEVAQDVMMEEGSLEWVTVEESMQHKEPIRVLLSSHHPLITKEYNCGSTVLICTGRGKVRGGIFSRQHLICSGLEMATAVPLVREAVTRNLKVAILDPNAHGEASGFVTFQKTMDFLESGHYGSSCSSEEQHSPSCYDLLVVSHSASGGHLVRYFLEKCDSNFLRNIGPIAFTDSTHSIQWARDEDKKSLFEKLQGQDAVYFRCARDRDGIAGDGNKWYLHPAGEEVQTDSFWRHRFGTIKTLWAGTNEHSLTNWYSHAKIWEHFDHYLYGKKFNRHDNFSLDSQAVDVS